MAEKIPIKASIDFQTSISERLYPDPHVSVVELVCNSWDADATEVRVDMSDKEIVVTDNGDGMDRKGIYDFFIIGRSTKPTSKLNRIPIGQFGVGKFSMLAVCGTFIVETQQNDFHGKVVYDEKEIKKQSEILTDNTLPLEVLPPNPNVKSFTIVTLKDLKKRFNIEKIKRKLVEALGSNYSDNFKVTVNGEVLQVKYVHGIKYPIDIDTSYGKVIGSVTYAGVVDDLGSLKGIQIQVSNRTVCRSDFGIGSEPWGVTHAPKMIGYINVDFLNDVIKTDRTGFIDSPKVDEVNGKMRERLKEIVDAQELRLAGQLKEREATILRRAIVRATEVLNKFKEYNFPIASLPEVEVTVEETSKGLIGRLETPPPPKPPKPNEPSEEPKSKGEPFDKSKTIAVAFEHLGQSAPDAFVDSGRIIVNVDHYVYQRMDELSKGYAAFYAGQLILREVVLLAGYPDIRTNFEKQGELVAEVLRTDKDLLRWL